MTRVHATADGELFLIGGRNEVLRLYTASGFADMVDLESWRGRLSARADFFAAHGIPWTLLLAPEKLSVRGDAVLAALLGADHQRPAARLTAQLGATHLADPCAFLRAQQHAGHQVFAATDSHWTPIGAFCGFQWAMAALGLQLDFAPYLALAPAPQRYHGDLWEPGMPQPPSTFARLAVPPWISRSYANRIVRLKERQARQDEAGLHQGCHVAYRNTRAQRPERLLLWGSSFSDHRAECTLLTFAAAVFFAEVHFVWGTELDLDLIRRLSPDLALLEMPERFLTHCPADRLDLAGYEHAMAGSDTPEV